MNVPIREIPLSNGLKVTIYDLTRRYFADYFRVRVEFVCEVPLCASYFSTEEAFAEARTQYGNLVVYSRCEEQMGVPSADIGTSRERLVENFIAHALPYVASPQFPERCVRAEMKKMARTKGSWSRY